MSSSGMSHNFVLVLNSPICLFFISYYDKKRMSLHKHHPKETSRPETSNSDSKKADDNERDEDSEQPVRTNLFHQFSIKYVEELAQDQGHDLDEQATKVDKRRR